jgi:cysteine desulfurase
MAHAPVYLDSHATTPVDPRVLAAMLPYFTEHFGNPASASHAWGWKAQEAVETARREAAALIGATAREIVFTSGATESNNFAVTGVAAHAPSDRRAIITSAIEHKSLLETSKRLGDAGWRVTILPVGRDGRIDLAALGSALAAAPTALVSVMGANNEIGVVQPLAEIGALAHAAGALFHVDGAQAVGKVPIDVNAMQIDLLSFTAHKMYGPKGCGALFIRKRTDLAPLIVGGGQERGMRSGTLNVPGIVGLGKACAICRAEMAEESARLSALRNRLLAGLQAGLPGVSVNGSMEHRLPHNLHVSFTDVDHASLVLGIGDIAVSSGSACGSASAEPSHVLRAIGGDASGHSATIRFGLSRFTTPDEIEYAIERFTTVVRKLRETAPGAESPVTTPAHENHGRS